VRVRSALVGGNVRREGKMVTISLVKSDTSKMYELSIMALFEGGRTRRISDMGWSWEGQVRRGGDGK